MTTNAEHLIAVARRFLFVRETDGPNRGLWVSFIQRFAAGQDGDSWCCQLESLIEDVAYHGKAPTVRTGNCHQKMLDCIRKGFTVQVPQPGDIYFFIDKLTRRAHHIGIVTGVGPLVGVAGNTSEDGLSTNGTGVFEHALHIDPSLIVFARTSEA